MWVHYLIIGVSYPVCWLELELDQEHVANAALWPPARTNPTYCASVALPACRSRLQVIKRELKKLNLPIE